MKATLLELLVVGLLGGPLTSNAAPDVSSAYLSYAQRFDSPASTASTSYLWTNDSALPGWSLFAQPTPGNELSTCAGGTGSNNVGSFYSFGTLASTSERNDVGNDHDLAIDNQVFSVSRAVSGPEPGTLARLGLGLADLGLSRR